ncbi:hypothetical protein AWB69_00316 [Caballeronia udeis]|uniref:Uncharacterized protein n=1 Tax=Caballeronia udeis TaxID=1232866 RepID=A0A158EVG5_9BURK|nr:hypothetical protein [Caballeronia udeis]SAL11524.1 hypothetical protein AWB69_00316 [Caballeronia udeis]
MFVDPTSLNVAQLTSFSGTLNISPSQSSYERKKSAFAQPGTRITKKLTRSHSESGFVEVKARSVAFAKNAVKIRPID